MARKTRSKGKTEQATPEPKERTRRPWGGTIFPRADRGGRLFLKFRDAQGRTVVRAATSQDPVEAERELAQLTGEVAQDVERGVREVRMTEFLEEFRPVLVGRSVARHARIVEAQVKRCAKALGNPTVYTVTAADADDYVAALGRRGCGPSTIRRHVAALSGFWKAAIERKAAQANVWRGLKLPKAAPPAIRFRPEGEVRKMIARCPKRIRPLFAFIAATGVRYGEAANLRWSQVAEDLAHVTLERTKSGRVRHVPLVGEARAIVEARRAARVVPLDAAQDYVFALRPATAKKPARVYSHGYASKLLTAALRKAKIDPSRPFHTLRNSLASRMVLSGVPVSVVAAALGDTVQVTAARYGHLMPDDAVARAYRAVGRRGRAAAGAATQEQPSAKPTAAAG